MLGRARIRRVTVFVGTVLLGILVASCSAGQKPKPEAEYPAKPIQIVVPYSAGGGTDLLARAFADVVGKWVKVPITVVNMPAGGGAEGERFVANAAPDGYTLGLGTTGSIMTVPMIEGNVGYTWESFEPIAILARPSFFFVVNVNSRWKSWQELLAYMKANPDKVTYANSGLGGSAQFCAEVLAKKLGFHWRAVPFNGSSPANQAVMTGSVDVGVPSTGSAMALLGTGKLRALVLTAPKRVPAMPDVPTFKELGEDFEFTIYRMLHAPKGTPQTVIRYWEDMAKKALEDKAFVEQATKIEGEPPEFEASAECKGRLQKEYAEMKPIADEIKVSR